MTSPLSSLIVDDIKSADQAKLAETLKPFVAIDKKTKKFGFLNAFHDLSNYQKIEIVLLASKACSLLFDKENDGMKQKEIVELGIMPIGSVKSSIKNLRESHKIKKENENRYVVPDYRIPELAKQFLNE